MSRQEKGDDLERSVLMVLEAFKTDGHIVAEYALAKKSSYPDFWVKDSKGREWLLECKNREPHGLKQGGIWMENLRWVQKNILSKDWSNAQYQVRRSHDERGRRHGSGTTYVNPDHPRPALVTTLLTYDYDALSALRDFFGDNIVQTIYPSWYAGSGWVLELVSGLRKIFTQP